MEKKHIFVLAIGLLLVVSVAFAGCTGDDSDENGEDDGNGNGGLSGTSTYSGEWSGTVGGEDYSGTWEFDVNFDEGNVTGSFDVDGGGSGDITGTVSDGEIEAEGNAGFGAVEWSGDFTSDGEEVSGSWELSEGAQYGSGTWSGTEQ
ncbi:MAG: hypothetical protein V5A88_07865 [Candidatus Thermoplasmatota archaeon]